MSLRQDLCILVGMRMNGGMLMHHGFLIAGGSEVLPALRTHLVSRGIEIDRNPDVYIREYRTFGIDDARELRERANSRSVRGGHRTFVVVTPTMTVDAQNALLKTLEEPPADAVFFLVVPAPASLLPTLRSRVHILQLKNTATGEAVVSVKEFLKAGGKERLDMLKPLYERDENDERDLRAAISFLTELEHSLGSQAMSQRSREGVLALYRARKYLTDKGALLKPLLEQMALLIPRS